MKFYSDKDCNEHVWTGKKLVTFKSGVIETDDKDTIDLLTKAGYRKDEADGQAEQRDTKRQTVKKKQTDRSNHTKNELVKELVERGIDFDKRQNKDELIKLLGGD